MSLNNIQDASVRNELRRLVMEVERLRKQLAILVDISGFTGFAKASDLTAHTGDSTIHFTEANIDHDNIANQNNNKHIHVGGSAPTGSEILWLDTTPAAPYSTLEMKLSGDSGSTWQRSGIGW